MNLAAVVRAVTLLALFLGVGACSEQREAEAVPAFAQQPASASRGVPAGDYRSGEVRLGVSADPESTATWRRNSIRALWANAGMSERQLTDDEIESILSRQPLDLLSVSAAEFMGSFGGHISYLINATPTLEKTPVGMLFHGKDEATMQPWCTVTLTAPKRALTARHCITQRDAGATLKVFFPYEGFRGLDPGNQWTLFCSGGQPNGCSTQVDDLAVLHLQAPYEILPVSPIDHAIPDGAGSQNTAVGYGTNDSGLVDRGIRREADVDVVGCAHCSSSTFLQVVERELCFTADVDNQLAVRLEGFDSGGPLFGTEVGDEELNGVARGEWDCITDGDYVEAKYVKLDHSFYEDWLKTKAQAKEPGLEESLTNDLVHILIERPNELLGASQTHSYSAIIPPRAKELVVALNHEVGIASHSSRIDLVLNPDLSADCVRHIGAEVCTVSNPSSGAIEVSVSRQTNCDLAPTECLLSRAFQLTALTINCADEACWTEHLDGPGVLVAPGPGVDN